MISSISSFENISVVSEPNISFWIAASVAGAIHNGTKTRLADGTSKFFINGKATLASHPTRYPTWLKKIKLAFCNPYGGVKTILKEFFPFVMYFSQNFVVQCCTLLSLWVEKIGFSFSLRIF